MYTHGKVACLYSEENSLAVSSSPRSAARRTFSRVRMMRPFGFWYGGFPPPPVTSPATRLDRSRATYATRAADQFRQARPVFIRALYASSLFRALSAGKPFGFDAGRKWRVYFRVHSPRTVASNCPSAVSCVVSRSLENRDRTGNIRAASGHVKRVRQKSVCPRGRNFLHTCGKPVGKLLDARPEAYSATVSTQTAVP
jgi:hypothetical protein